MILMWFLGVPTSDSRGFVLYKDDDKTDEVLSYTSLMPTVRLAAR